jgi:hypothetical protein
MKHHTLAWVMAMALPLAAPHALAASDTELQLLREELQRLKADYERRIDSLERRLADATPAAPAAAAPAPVAQPQPQPQPAAARASAFNPEISAILAGTYTGTRLDPTRERRVQGFIPSGGEAAPEQRSFSLGESELGFAANIDPRFRGNLLLAVGGDNSLGVEEANIQTLGLGQGFKLKFGRFLSGIGYLNELHPHAWDFADAALPYRAFFAGRLGYDGVQLKWLAPTRMFLELGAETGRAGDFPANDGARNKNGLLSGSLFAHLGDDVGLSHSWRAGLSYFHSRPKERDYEDTDSTGTGVNNRFAGTSRTLAADFVWKWAPQGDATDRSFKLQGELFRRKESGELTYDVDAASLGTAAGAYRAAPSGGYLQGVWQFARDWRAGYRYDWLRSGSMAIGLVDSGALSAADFPLLQPHRPQRHTLMADWRSSEFATVRFQVARDETRPGSADTQVWLQYIMSLGSHGAHRF